MSILTEIIATKKEEISFFKPLSPVRRFIDESFYWHSPRRSLINELKRDASTGIIAEFKRRSPSKGWINQHIEPETVIPHYDTAAAGISVLTDEKYFGGSLDDLMASRQLTAKPLLRKDFIIDEWQIAEARAFGGDVILLIAACLSPMQVRDLAAVAKHYEMEVILELHDESETDHICDDIEMVGINNRNLKTFEVDIEQCIRMADKIPSDKILIAESGIKKPEDVCYFRQNGFKGFLAGEVFMKEAYPGEAFTTFVKKLQS